MDKGENMTEMLKVQLTGRLPLLMHNERLANPLDPAAKKLKALTAKRKKTDDDHLAISYTEFEGGLYHDDEVGPYVPIGWLMGMLRDGGKLTKQGKDVTRAITLEQERHPLEYDGPRDIEGLWKKGFLDRRMVGNQKNRILRTRPRFDKWRVGFNLMYDESVFDQPQVEAILKNGGQMVGLGDYRPMFGRFEAEVS